MIAPAPEHTDRAPNLQIIALTVLAQEIDTLLLGRPERTAAPFLSPDSITRQQPSATSLHT
jgi:hypothetical protein